MTPRAFFSTPAADSDQIEFDGIGYAKAGSIASASTITVPGYSTFVDSPGPTGIKSVRAYYTVTGTTPIGAVTFPIPRAQPHGRDYFGLEFEHALTLTQGAAGQGFQLPGGVNYTTAPGEIAVFEATTGLNATLILTSRTATEISLGGEVAPTDITAEQVVVASDVFH